MADDLPDKKCESHGIDASRYKIAQLDRRGSKTKAEWIAADLEM